MSTHPLDQKSFDDILDNPAKVIPVLKEEEIRTIMLDVVCAYLEHTINFDILMSVAENLNTYLVKDSIDPHLNTCLQKILALKEV